MLEQKAGRKQVHVHVCYCCPLMRKTRLHSPCAQEVTSRLGRCHMMHASLKRFG